MDELNSIVTPDSPLGLLRSDLNPSQAEIDGAKLADDFDDFLLLLTTQLENQDPTEPLDTNEFTSQLVEFAGVEQAVATNLNLERLVAASSAAGIQQGLGYIGNVIEANGNRGVLSDGNAVFTYELPQDAFAVDVTILDSTGRAVFNGAGDTQAGKNTVVWDGISSLTGEPMPEGTYQIVVRARDFREEEIDVTTFTTGRVNSAEIDESGNTVLNVGSERIRVEDVLAVREVPAATTIAPPVANTNEQPVADATDDETTGEDAA